MPASALEPLVLASRPRQGCAVPSQAFFTTIAGLSVSLAGFASLIAWLRDGDPRLVPSGDRGGPIVERW